MKNFALYFSDRSKPIFVKGDNMLLAFTEYCNNNCIPKFVQNLDNMFSFHRKSKLVIVNIEERTNP